MTKKELQELINFLVDELRKLNDVYEELLDDVSSFRRAKNKFHDKWFKAEDKAKRRDELLYAIKGVMDQDRYYGDDVIYALNEIGLIIDKWYEEKDEEEDEQYDQD